MPSLTIRNIPEETKRRFRLLAAANGQSMEEQARQMIIAAVNDQARPSRKPMFEILYEASRPGFELPIPPRTPARIPTIDGE